MKLLFILIFILFILLIIEFFIFIKSNFFLDKYGNYLSFNDLNKSIKINKNFLSIIPLYGGKSLGYLIK